MSMLPVFVAPVIHETFTTVAGWNRVNGQKYAWFAEHGRGRGGGHVRRPWYVKTRRGIRSTTG